MTDFEKFVDLLTEIGCGFRTGVTFDSRKYIIIDNTSMISYGVVSIEFNRDGKFIGFCE